jgi:hypothetical protein
VQELVRFHGFHYSDERSGRNPARSSAAKICGCSHAAKPREDSF